MRSIAQLAAGAARGDPRRAEATCARSAPPTAPAPAPDSAPLSREALLRLVEGVAPRLGLTDRALRALRAVVCACRWADFTGERPNPVCFRQQQRLAQEIGVTPGHFRKLEAQLERAGLLARATCENGHRGRLAPGPGAPVAGLSLAPLLASVPRLEALAEAMAAERAALAEGRALIRIERRAAWRAMEGLAPDHAARVAYEALRGAGFRRSARYDDARAIAAHLAELRVVIEAAPPLIASLVEEPLDTAAATAVETLDDTIGSGAALPEERRHTEVPTDPQTGSWSVTGHKAGAGGSGARSRERDCTWEAQEKGREQDERPQPGTRTATDAQDRHGEAPADGPVPPSRLPPKLLCRLTPRALRDLGSEELRLYADHLEPSGMPLTLRAVERAALLRRRELGITPEAWEEAEAALGWLDALVALVVIDRNRDHPTAPVRNPGGLLRDLARRRRMGTLDLGASVMGVWRREEQEPSVAASCSPEAP